MITVTSAPSSSTNRVLDRAEWLSTYTVPTTAASQQTAVAVPGAKISPTVPTGGGLLRLSAFTWLNHGSAGWSAGRNVIAFIADATSGSTSPVPTRAIGSTNGQVTGGIGGNVPTLLQTEYSVPAADAGTRIFQLYVYLASSLSTGAQVFGIGDFLGSWIMAESVWAYQ